MAYKLTFIYHIYNSLILITNRIWRIFSKVKETKNTVKETDFKIEWEIEIAEKKITQEVREWTIINQTKE